MNNRCALVSRLIPFSCVDGPGNRLALLLQGCNPRCKNCHNPWTMGRCNGFGERVLRCPHEVLNLSAGKARWQSDMCQQCDTRLYMCPRQATSMVQSMSVDEVLQHIRKASLLIEGVTISGGEATTQLPFIMVLFTAIKTDPQLQHPIYMVDNNGMLSRADWQKLLPVCDDAVLDLKAWDNTYHRQLTNHDSTLIKQSIISLSGQRKLAELHLLVIPGQTGHLQYIDALAAFVIRIDDASIQLNAFHAHGVYGETKDWSSAAPEDVEQLV